MGITNMHAQETSLLYPEKIPGAIEGPNLETSVKNGITIVSKITIPTITAYLPEITDQKKSAIIIFPGGGYAINAIEHEGHDVAKWLQSQGIAAFVVKYRIPDTSTMLEKEWGPLQDAEQAIKTVRSNAKKWGINSHKIGVMGFSAGGHLAAFLSTHYTKDLVQPHKVSLRPDFTVLIYPVVSFTDSIGHIGSRTNLIGPDISEQRIKEFSNEFHVNKKSPPAFLAHAKDDWVNYKNSVVYTNALQEAGIKNHLLLFEKGGHGYGMQNKESTIQWPDELMKWMKEMKFK